MFLSWKIVKCWIPTPKVQDHVWETVPIEAVESVSKHLPHHIALQISSVVSSLSSTHKVAGSNLGSGTFSNWRQSSKQRYTSQNSDKRAYFLPAFRAQNADIWRKSDRKAFFHKLFTLQTAYKIGIRTWGNLFDSHSAKEGGEGSWNLFDNFFHFACSR